MTAKKEYYNRVGINPETKVFAEEFNKSQYAMPFGEEIMGSTPVNYFVDIGAVNAYSVIIAHGKSRSAGINTTATTFKLIDSGATFIASGIKVDHAVLNLTDTTEAKVVSIDSETQLTLDTDIFTGTTKSYKVGADVFQLPQSYVAGQAFYIKITNTNTAGSTLNINGIGAITIKHPEGTALNAGDLQANIHYRFMYDGTNFIVEYARTSQTPTANTIPVSEGDGKLNDGWINTSQTPTANTIPTSEGDGKLNPGWVDSITEYNGQVLKCKIIEIGDWNMDTTETKGIAHNIDNFTEIRKIECMIRHDNGSYLLPLNTIDSSIPLPHGGIMTISEVNLTLIRITGRDFDSTNYDTIPFNRGWVTIWYVD